MVEDEERLSEVPRLGLIEHGYAVDISGDGKTGLEPAPTNNYTPSSSIIMLPKMNGYHVCATLREDNIWTPILVLTAKSGEYDHAEALETGADATLASQSRAA